jgi:DNA helicase-2/ATP-dependent DNA helicase PcrA
MTRGSFIPTAEQERVIGHGGSAFISACPGAGKTRVLVERARRLLTGVGIGKGIAFLSFTRAAVSEFEQRLKNEGVLPSPAFPHFIGTFDSFLWQFLIAPFGVPGCETVPRLVPDKELRTVGPRNSRELPLKCFDRTTGAVIPEAARRNGFDPAAVSSTYSRIAASTRERFRARGELDFDDARAIAADRLRDLDFATRLAVALAARFREVIVDEAQDCSPADIEIIRWLRQAGIAMKVISDPHQSIYGFRGGVSDELIAFGNTFDATDRLPMSGNFRSSAPICQAIVALRPPGARAVVDVALGDHVAVTTPVHILAYRGSAVPASIGATFGSLARAEGFDLTSCPVLAATRASAAKATGHVDEGAVQDITRRLAAAVTGFYTAFEAGSRTAALVAVHRVVLEIQGALGVKTYHQHLVATGAEPMEWRPRILKLVRALRYDPAVFATPRDWHTEAKRLLAPLLPADGRTIAQRLPWNADLPTVLGGASANSPARTIHSVKGMEFPAVCVVMTAATTGDILAYLETGGPVGSAEDARKIYVAASRAERLLTIAVPRGHATRLKDHLGATGTPVIVTNL